MLIGWTVLASNAGWTSPSLFYHLDFCTDNSMLSIGIVSTRCLRITIHSQIEAKTIVVMTFSRPSSEGRHGSFPSPGLRPTSSALCLSYHVDIMWIMVLAWSIIAGVATSFRPKGTTNLSFHDLQRHGLSWDLHCLGHDMHNALLFVFSCFR